ncbi:hypothetical protein F5X98DRAFT_311841 [Xylaria grammica]|nr:hypothetical protein F5X98DRAFT_311841 [Xylaria grammica]
MLRVRLSPTCIITILIIIIVSISMPMPMSMSMFISFVCAIEVKSECSRVCNIHARVLCPRVGSVHMSDRSKQSVCPRSLACPIVMVRMQGDLLSFKQTRLSARHWSCSVGFRSIGVHLTPRSGACVTFPGLRKAT